MTERTATPRQRVQIRFRPAPGAPGVAADDRIAEASDPKPSWLVDITPAGGRVPLGTFELWNPNDLASAEMLKLTSIERETAALEGGSYVTRIREQVRLLMPDLPDETFELLTHRQLHTIGARCWEAPGESKRETGDRKADAANPLGGERDSDSSSRSPHASTAGATAS